MKSELQKITTAGKLVMSVSGDGTATDIVINFSDGSKLVIPKNTAAATITTKVEETDTYVKVTITTTSNGVATAESFIINKPVGTVNGIVIMSGFQAPQEVMAGAENKSVVVRVNPSSALFVAENLKLDSLSGHTYASYVIAPKTLTVSDIETINPGEYRVSIKAIGSDDEGKYTPAPTAADYFLVYSAPVEGKDPINTTSELTIDFKAIDYDGLDPANDLLAAAGNIYNSGAFSDPATSTGVATATIGSTTSIPSVSLLSNAAKQALIKGVTYEVIGVKKGAATTDADKKAAKESVTIAADPKDMTKFIITPVASKFTKKGDSFTVTVKATFKQILGKDVEQIFTSDLTIVTAFPSAEVTLAAQAKTIPGVDADAGAVTIAAGSQSANIPAPFDQAWVLDSTTLSLTVLDQAGKEIKAADQPVAAATTATTVANIFTDNKYEYQTKATALPGNYTIVFKLEDNRTLLGNKGVYSVKVPLTVNLPKLVAKMKNIDLNDVYKDGLVVATPTIVTTTTANTTMDTYFGAFVTALLDGKVYDASNSDGNVGADKGSAGATAAPAMYDIAFVAKPMIEYINVDGAKVTKDYVAASYNNKSESAIYVQLCAGGAIMPIGIIAFDQTKYATQTFAPDTKFGMIAYTNHIATDKINGISAQRSELATKGVRAKYLELKDANGTVIPLVNADAVAGTTFIEKGVTYTLAMDAVSAAYILFDKNTGALTSNTAAGTLLADITGTITVTTEDIWGNKKSYTVPVTVKAD